jgi:signal transduction histidine kinase
VTALVVIALLVVVALGRRIVCDAERLRLVAEAEHELRGPLQAIALALEPRGSSGNADVLRPELERARVALADLSAARSGERAKVAGELVRLDRLVWRAVTASDVVARRSGGGVHLDWSAGPVAIRANYGRLAQALSNLLANALEHGGGQVRVTGRRTTRGIRVEVRDSGRGHGLAIATKAVREAGGTLSAGRAGSGTAVAIELPLPNADGSPHASAGDAGGTSHPGRPLRISSAEPPAAA